MGVADACPWPLSEIIAGKTTYEKAPGIKPDNSFVPMTRFADPVEKKAA